MILRRDCKGLTLIELVIALGLLASILALGYALYFFATSSFNRGETQSRVQFDLRMASAFITKEVRNATSLALIPTPTAFVNNNNMNYIFVRDGRIIHRLNGVETAKTDAIIPEPLIFRLHQLTDADNIVRNVLEFTLTGRLAAQQHSISTEVFLNNLHGLSIQDNHAIRYAKP